MKTAGGSSAMKANFGYRTVNCRRGRPPPSGCRATWRAPSVNGRGASLAGAPGDAAGDGIGASAVGSGSRSVPACRARRAAGGFLPLPSLLRLLRHEMHLSRTESACLCGLQRAVLPADCTLRDRRHSARRSDPAGATCAIAAVSTRCWPASSKWAKRWSRRWRAK